jgi:2-keto-4-pentenoate hydratase/2-oxohepta-3-ene-1,7-dioic acid hydratase in catechol pathway
MRLATILDSGRPVPAVVEGDQVLAITAQDPDLVAIRAIAARGMPGLTRLRAWIARRPSNAARPLEEVELGPAVPDPGAIFTIADNYAGPNENPRRSRAERPAVGGKLPTAVAGQAATVGWNRTLTATVDAGVSLGIVIGEPAYEVRPADAPRHVLGYTCVTDIGSPEPELGGELGLLGRSLPGFCPVGPWIVTADELEPHDLRLACAVNGRPIQDARTSQMRFSTAEIVSYLSYHVPLQPGDLIATGTPARRDGQLGSERHLEAGDVITSWIEGIGTLTTKIG